MIEKLRRYRDMTKEANELKERIIRMSQRVYGVRITDYSDLPKNHSASSDMMTDAIVMLDELKAKYNKLVAQLIDMRIEIGEAMNDKLNETEYALIYLRYFEGQPWKKISKKIGYAQRQTFNIHKKALDKLAQ